MADEFHFATIDLSKHADVCVDFRRDSFICSFGYDQGIIRSNSDEKRYLEWLRMRISEWPEGAVHLWHQDRIIGQLEMRQRQAPGLAYVNLFYLVCEARGYTAGDMLHSYALAQCRKRHLSLVQLSVSPTNARALAYYRKHGWIDKGPRPDSQDVHLMERPVVLSDKSETLK